MKLEEQKSNEVPAESEVHTQRPQSSFMRESERSITESELIEDEEDFMEPNAYVERDPKDILVQLMEYCKM